MPEALRFECEVIQVSQTKLHTIQLAMHPQLAQLELLVNPTVETLLSDGAMANAGSVEIIPLEQPLTLFVWSVDAHQKTDHLCSVKTDQGWSPADGPSDGR